MKPYFNLRFPEFRKLLRAVSPIAVAALLWTTAPVNAEPVPGSTARLIASSEPDWPQWRGPARNGISRETGLLRAWPEGGPRMLWQADSLGNGYSAPILAQNRIYLTGDVANDLRIFALDLDGKPLWQSPNGAGWKTPYPGARASCTFSDGRLYHLNAHGRLACLRADTGQEIWAVDVLERFDARNVTWAMSECLLVHEDKVFVTVGGSKALVAALDKRSGQTLWTTPGLRIFGPEKARNASGDQYDQASYGSPILVEFGGRRILVNSSQAHVFGVDAGSGELLWTHHLPTRYWVIAATPTLVDDAIFVSAPDTTANRLLQLAVDGTSMKAEPLWKTAFDNGHGGVLRVGDELFGGWYRRKGWAGVDIRTGEPRQRLDAVGAGSVVMADGLLYCLSQDGEMALVEPKGERFPVLSNFRLVQERKSDVWTHPVILDGRLYLRYQGSLYCYDIRAR